ncbi:hypothetical protein AC579_294 [Pseudocercospora musae]|uniref:Uncharacterized protein n=1 Tax=Pseudocercospora musae TaxID=113226 RepID=A0A139I996_9PEZI|nr:hypothetical protein AC579_294 [Pseudocercospora musae]
MSLSLPMIAPTVSSLEQDDVAIISTGSKMARFCTDEAAFGLDFGRGHRLVVGFHKGYCTTRSEKRGRATTNNRAA